MAKIFEDVTGGCSTQSACPEFPGCGDLSRVSPNTFVSYLLN